MNIGQKQNKNIFPTSIYTFSAEELNQIVNELQHIIDVAGLTKDASDSTQVLQGLRKIFEYIASTKVTDDNGVNIKSQYQRNRDFEAAISGGLVSLTGVYIPYGGSTLPTGWLWCDGSAISRIDYAELFAIIGTTFGQGDGSTTFNIPDLTGGRFIEGQSLSGAYKDASIPQHYHLFGYNYFHNNSGRFTSTNNFANESAIMPNSDEGNVGWNGSGSDSAEYRAAETFTGNLKTTTALSSNRVTNDTKYGINGKTATGENTSILRPKSMTSRWIIRY